MTRYLYILLLSLFAMGNTGCPKASDFMRLYGYTEIRPPSKLLSPGTMVLIVKGAEPFEAKIICDAYDSLGDVELSESKTASGMLKNMQGRTSNLDAGVLGMIKQNSRYQHVQNIEVTLDNVAVMEVTDANILESMHQRSKSCAYAIKRRVKEGYDVSMVSSALVADVRYNVRWERKAEESLSYDDKMHLLHELSATLSGEMQATTDSAIYAKGLIWGIRDDQYLAALSTPSLDEAAFERNTKQITPDKITVLPAIEAAP